MSYPAIIKPNVKPYTSRPRGGLFGDSRFSGSGEYNGVTNTTYGNVGQLVNRALNGAAVIVGSGYTTTINSTAVNRDEIIWRGYAKGGNTLEQNMPFDILSTRDQLDFAVIEGGFNNLADATVTSTSTLASALANHNNQLRTHVAFHVNLGRKVILLTLWGGGTKHEGNRLSANIYRRQLAAEWRDRGVYLLDIGDAITANAAYYVAGESIATHQSVAGNKYLAGQIAQAIKRICPTSTLTANPYGSLTVNSENGICRFEPFTANTNNLEATNGFSSIGTTSMFWGKCEALTAAAGTATMETAADPDGYGNIQTWRHLSGGASWINNEYNSNSFVNYSAGDRLAFELPISMTGMEAGKMCLHAWFKWAGGAATDSFICYKFQGDDGDWGGGVNVGWGLLYGEVIVPPAAAAAGSVGAVPTLQMKMLQSDDSAVAAGHTGVVAMKQLCLRNLTTRREFYMGQDVPNYSRLQSGASGTTAQRDAQTWAAGATFYNTTTSKPQMYNGAAWVDLV